MEAHLQAASRRHGEADPAVEAAYETLADAYQTYDDAIYEAYDEVDRIPAAVKVLDRPLGGHAARLALVRREVACLRLGITHVFDHMVADHHVEVSPQPAQFQHQID